MAYEKLFYQDLAKKLARQPEERMEKALDQELKLIKDRTLTLNKAKEEMSKGFSLILNGLKTAYPQLDLDDPNLQGTPERVARSYLELCSGLGVTSCKELFATKFPLHASHASNSVSEDLKRDTIILKDIEFTSICAHHFLPFTGLAHIAYIPNSSSSGETRKEVVGLSKLARVVDVYANRPQLQEKLCLEILQTIVEELSPAGVIVVIEAKHECIACRGVKKNNTSMITFLADGLFHEDKNLRLEFFNLIKK